MSDIQQPAQNNQGSVLDNVLPFLAGAGNSALFGLPEYIARQFNQKGVEDYTKKYEPAYNAGGIAGAIGSSFIPVVGVAGKIGQAIGAGTKLAGLAKAGEALTGLTKTANLGGKALLGATEGAIQSAARTATGDQDGDMLGNVAQAGVLGGGLGIAGGLLGKATKAAKDLKDFTRGNVLGSAGQSTKTLLSGLSKRVPKGASDAYKMGKQQQDMDDIAAFVKKHGLDNPSGRDEKITDLFEGQKEAYKKLDSLFNEAGESAIQPVKNAATGNMKDLEMYPDKINIMNKLMDDFDNQKGLQGKREFLQKNTDRFWKSTDIGDGIIHDALADMKYALDDQVNALAQASGDKTLKAVGKEYGMTQTLAKGVLRDEAKIPAMGTGSPTAEKTIAMAGLGLGGAATGAQADWSDPAEMAANIGKVAAGGLAGYAGSKAAPYLIRQASKLGDTGLGKFIESGKGQQALSSVENIGNVASGLNVAGAVASPLGAAAGAVLPKIINPQQAKLLTPEQIAKQAKAGADSNDPEKMSGYHDVLLNRLQQIYQQQYAPVYGNDPQAFSQFISGVYQASNGFQPEKTAHILFPDKDTQDRYIKALGQQTIIKDMIQPATDKKMGMHIGWDSPEVNAAYSAVESQFVASLANAGVDKSIAKKQLEEIMKQAGTAEEKLKKIYNTMQVYDKGAQAIKKAGIK